MKTIRIFIASSSELKEDRDQFRLFISTENDRLHKKGLYLELVQWEYFLDAISDTRLQSEYNAAIRSCDIVLCLFFTKVGKYTAEEFDTAYEIFKDQGKPRIWTYFKNAQINTGAITEEINTLLAFKKKIGDLGHFHTEYSNIDNLINKYRSQLDLLLPSFEAEATAGTLDTKPADNGGEATAPPANHFNELLTSRLLLAIRPHHRKAEDFLAYNGDWAENDTLVRTAKQIIINAYVGVVGVQIRKLMSIGEEDFSRSKMERYLENCHITAKRSIQLLCYALLSKLWDHQVLSKIDFSRAQSEGLTKFFRNAAEEDLLGFLDLLRLLLDIFSGKKLDILLSESLALLPKLSEGSQLFGACAKLAEIPQLLESRSYGPADCLEAETNLATVLEELAFLAEYRMISINEIDFNQQRNDQQGLYLHNYTLLVGESQAKNGSQNKVRRESSPVISHAVILFKDNYRDNINLDPFIIDFNGLALSGGSKICFYSHCNTFGNLDLNFSFIEDNSLESIRKSNNPKPDEANLNSLNAWLSKRENRRDMNFDKVYSLFFEAKRALTGVEEEVDDDSF
ncbi:hypothetical protein J0A68_01705 [Algoriphagus sp. H41]|uniref:DUF4062 domain-containing protein n=1 Tax=Algoriphagus oliviformis TaxID=2811231 RepID=A0ABS3BXR1_9BACT|nr:hypothetical protein [Algoriphagus oliviformis]MBN7809652.1 hypothetical protein [Algoriphagus oliviformis]